MRCRLLAVLVAMPLLMSACSLVGQLARPSPAVADTPAVASTPSRPSALVPATIGGGKPPATPMGASGQLPGLAGGQTRAATVAVAPAVTTQPRQLIATRTGAWGRPFSLSAGQARAVATVTTFLNAYNAGQLDAALALLADNSGMSDCDYRAGAVIALEGKAQIAAWLRERIADHDQLIVSQMENENPDQSGSGAHVVGVVYVRRESDTLRALGNRDGIVPQLATKVILTADDLAIISFANGPYGGPPDECRRMADTPAP